MRAQIWQEFSSNNSARFTVVGVFESVEKAKLAADKLTEMLRAIFDWYNQPENAEALMEWHEAGAQPSPPELQIAEQYQIEWSTLSLDWLWFDGEGHGPIEAFDNLVFIDGTESWLGSKPADALVEKLGGQALVDGVISLELDNEYGSLIRGASGQVTLDLSCLALNDIEAKNIYDEISNYLELVKQDEQRLFETPWRSQDWIRLSSFEGEVSINGRKLIIRDGSFFHIGSGLPDMLNYLKQKGCVNIEYTLTEKRRE